MTRERISRVLIAILIGAFLLRVVGLQYGLPYRLVGDEESYVGGALKMLELKTFIPAFAGPGFEPFYLPPVMYYALLPVFLAVLGVQYLTSGAGSLAVLRDSIALDPTWIWLSARVMSVFMGTVSVWLVYIIGRDLISSRAGLFAAALLATSFMASSISHFARHWVPALLVVLLALWASSRLLTASPGHSRRWYLWIGVFAGLGFGVNYVPMLALLLLFAAHLLKHGGTLWTKLRSRTLWAAVGIAAAIGVAIVLLHPNAFFRILVGEAGSFSVHKSASAFAGGLRYYGQALIVYEPALVIFGLLGFGYLFFARRRIFWFLAPFMLVYLAALYLFFHDEVRYVLLLVPFLALAGAAVLDWFWSRSPTFAFTLVVAALAFSGVTAARLDFLLLQDDTRLLAKAFVENNIPVGAAILTTVREVRLTPTRASLEAQALLDPASLRAPERALLRRPEDTWPTPRFATFNAHFVAPEQRPAFEASQFQYVLLQYRTPADLAEAFKALRERSELVKSFIGSPDVLGNDITSPATLFSLKRLGPTMELRVLKAL
ncbi:glycosyltransferase family 39 protein [Candidatus Parcubacteria bacterium]|nr:glycosyltransferase family 39 protein [Candidatus Parcubacteria bacterium]